MQHTLKVNGLVCVEKWLEIKQLFHYLMGMGLDEFSMSATSILKTRSLMKRLDTTKMAELANRALNDCDTMEEVVELVNQYVK
jgi:phosphoenolpyruvate-protein kinase (PTS system EI component)